MQPTMKLRQIRRESEECCGRTEHGDYVWMRDTLVLQQWWDNGAPLGSEFYKGEWRDIEIQEE